MPYAVVILLSETHLDHVDETIAVQVPFLFQKNLTTGSDKFLGLQKHDLSGIWIRLYTSVDNKQPPPPKNKDLKIKTCSFDSFSKTSF